MEIKLVGNLKIETDIPILKVVDFHFFWRLDCHAMLKLTGYMNSKIEWNPGVYVSHIKIFLEEADGIKILFCGCVVKVLINTAGNMEQIYLESMSATFLLDQQIASRSFQNPEKTYGEVVRQAVEMEGGQVIRNKECDKQIKSPVIRYEETVWQFVGRMAGRLGTYIIPDVETGKSNLWFGMRKGKEVCRLSEEQCTIDLFPIGKEIGIRYKVEGRIPYKIGDCMTCLGRKLTIIEVEGGYELGELIFKYILEDLAVRRIKLQHHSHSAGLGLRGTIRDIKAESVTISLDIDNGKNTGDYFYSWQPDTGNSLYAMPEKGTRVLLYFYSADERDGAVIHCLDKESEKVHNYKNRVLDLENGDSVYLSKEEVNFSKDGEHNLVIGDGSVFAGTQKGLSIHAGTVWLRGKRILIKTPDEFNISQG